jgi:hypothetical protein
MMDDTILNYQNKQRASQKQIFLFKGNPKRLLCSKWHRISMEDEIQANDLIADLERNNFGMLYPKFTEQILIK